MRSHRLSRFAHCIALCLALCLVVAGAGLPGCGPRRPVEREGGILRLLLPRTVAVLDPHRSQVGTPLHSALFDTLLVRGTDNLPRSGLARTWQVSADGLAVSLELHQSAYFHDGTPVTGIAVVKNVERILAGTNEQFPIRALLGPMREARADGQQVTLLYDSPFPPVWSALSDPRLSIVAPTTLALLDEPGGAEAIPWAAFAGSGPYRLVQTQADEIALERYSSYSWPPSTIDNPGASYPNRLEVLLSDGGEAPGESAAGAPDDAGPSPDIVWWPADRSGPSPVPPSGPELEWRSYPFGGHRLIYLAIDQQQSPLTDPVVRQAFSLSIDREGLLKVIDGSVSVTASLVPGGLPGAVAKRGAGGGPAAAADILDRAGWVPEADGVRQKGGTRLEVRLATYEDTEAYDRLADRICDELEAAGIACRRVAPRRYFDPDLVEGAPNLWLLFYDWPDPDVLYYLFHSSQLGASNRSRYRNVEVDLLLSAARQDMDPDRRADMYRQAQILITGDAGAVPLFESRGQLFISTRVAGFKPQAPGSLLLHDLYLRVRE